MSPLARIRPRQRRSVTSQDVADAAGVSRTTVSLVLNETPGSSIPDETRQRVLRAAQELGYTPHAAARALVTSKSYLLGFILCQSADQVFSDAFLPDVLRGVSQVAYPQGYRILVEPVEKAREPGTYIDLVREQRIDGLILSGPRSDDRQLDELGREDFPLVLLGRLPGSTLPSVDVDNVSGARKAVEHLLRLGHRHIGLITNAPPQYTASADRLKGYQQALRDHGLPFQEERVRFGDFTAESGYAGMGDLLDRAVEIEAVFVASDVVALGALAAIHERGLLIPQDIAVVGFDDTRLARYTSPPLTTVHLPARDLGARAASILLRRIQDRGDEAELVLLETELVIRESCGHALQGP